MQDQDGRLDVLEIGRRRPRGVSVGPVPGIAAQILQFPARGLRVGKVGDQREDAELGHGGLEAVGVADDPVGQIAAIGRADDGQPSGSAMPSAMAQSMPASTS